MENGKKTLYLECESGISGDMAAAALLDLGADETVLRKALQSLPVGGYEVHISRVKKSGLDMCDFDVLLEHENHDHDMEYLHGHEHAHEHVHGHHDHHDHHDHGSEAHHHGHGHEHSHPHEHRGMAEIREILEQAELTPGARKLALRIFEILAEAEAKAHGVPKDQVHFHEVGAVDSIVDITAAAVCLDNLNIGEVILPVLKEGTGTIRCQHGILPVPVPAVANIVNTYGLPLHITGIHGELVTPTGAAIAAAVRTCGTLPDRFTVERIGMGAGKRDYEAPGFLRAMLIRAESENQDQIMKLETNVDDCSGENLGYTLNRLMEAGARDAHFIPVYMKKNRPGYQLNVICTPEDAPELERIIFEETSTIGIRKMLMKRTVMDREIRTVQTPLGEAKIKICRYQGIEKRFPEYESVNALCRKSGKNYQEVYRMVEEAGRKDSGGSDSM